MESLVAVETGSWSKTFPQSAGITRRTKHPQNQESRAVLGLIGVSESVGFRAFWGFVPPGLEFKVGFSLLDLVAPLLLSLRPLS